MTDFCAQNTFLNQNSDVFLGYIAWAAGSFATSYTLSLTPSKQNGKFVDNALASQCVVSPWLNAGTAVVTSAVAASSTASNANTAVISSASGSAPARGSSSVTEGKASITTLTSNNGGVKTSSPTTGSGGSAATGSGVATISSSPTGARNSSEITTGSQTTASTQTQVTSAAVAGKIGAGLMAGAGGLLIAALL